MKKSYVLITIFVCTIGLCLIYSHFDHIKQKLLSQEEESQKFSEITAICYAKHAECIRTVRALGKAGYKSRLIFDSSSAQSFHKNPAYIQIYPGHITCYNMFYENCKQISKITKLVLHQK